MSKIEELRRNKNYTQSDLAQTLGVTQQAVARWESGQSLPRADVLKKLTAILDCTADELLGIDERKEE